MLAAAARSAGCAVTGLGIARNGPAQVADLATLSHDKKVHIPLSSGSQNLSVKLVAVLSECGAECVRLCEGVLMCRLKPSSRKLSRQEQKSC